MESAGLNDVHDDDGDCASDGGDRESNVLFYVFSVDFVDRVQPGAGSPYGRTSLNRRINRKCYLCRKILRKFLVVNGK